MTAAIARRGACPTLAKPMPTGDGLLVRIDPIGHELTPQGLAGLADAARRHGNGLLELTARGSLQIRGLSDNSVPGVAEAIRTLGIDIAEGVVIRTGPLAGLDPDEIADPRPLAAAIRIAVERAGVQERLSPKIALVVDGGGRLGMDRLACDLRLRATMAGHWALDLADEPLAVLASPQVPGVVTDLLKRIAGLGTAARGRDLDNTSARAALPAIHDLPPDSVPGPRTQTIGRHPLRDGRLAVGAAVAFGELPADRLDAFAATMTAFGIPQVRIAPERTLLAVGVPENVADRLASELAALGMITRVDDPRLQIDACPGDAGCASGHLAARRVAAELARACPDFLDGSVHVHVSGCAKGCAHPGASGLTVVGTAEGCGVVLAGGARATPELVLPTGRLLPALRRLATDVTDQRRPGENSATCLARMGPGVVSQLLREGR